MVVGFLNIFLFWKKQEKEEEEDTCKIQKNLHKHTKEKLQRKNQHKN